MVFSSSLFLLYFLPIFLLVYHIVPKSWKNYIILISSILFYTWGAPQFVFLLLSATIITFYLVKLLSNSKVKKTRRTLLFFSVSINLGLLVYFKYSNFFVDNLNVFISSLGFKPIAWLDVALPIGISFYTFQTITYALDVYRKVHLPLDKLSNYVLYIMAFPQMIAGPIVRFNTIADQIISREEKIDDKLIGLYRFIIGLGKKVLIANVMAEQADLIMDGNILELSSSMAWVGIFAYTMQIYFDFSGYSDMAIGLGKIMGFRFPENFSSPYTSKSITEFWRRWHITLGAFMKDYLYIPLGGNRVGKNRLYFNLALVFLLSGLWHGASWNFVIWGGFHGLFLILDRLFLLKFLSKLPNIFSILITFFLTIMGWVIFRIENMTDAINFYQVLFSFKDMSNLELIPEFGLIAVLAIIFSFLASIKIGRKIINFFFERDNYTLIQHIALSLSTIILLILSISFVVSSDFNPFIYYRF